MNWVFFHCPEPRMEPPEEDEFCENCGEPLKKSEQRICAACEEDQVWADEEDIGGVL